MLALCRSRWSWAFGSYPAALALERGACVGLAAAIAAAPLALVPMPPRPLGLVGIAYLALWLAVAVGHDRCFAACRRRSRLAGLTVLVVVPESPRLAVRLFRRRGIEVAMPALACSVHVDPCWRPAGALTPSAAAEAFGQRYRGDYDHLLLSLRGAPVLIGSSTFNRHESRWTEAAIAAGWGWQRSGPLFAGAARRNGPRTRATQQRRMFGGLVSSRRADRPEAWRTRVFDCQARRPVC